MDRRNMHNEGEVQDGTVDYSQVQQQASTYGSQNLSYDSSVGGIAPGESQLLVPSSFDEELFLQLFQENGGFEQLVRDSAMWGNISSQAHVNDFDIEANQAQMLDAGFNGGLSEYYGYATQTGTQEPTVTAPHSTTSGENAQTSPQTGTSSSIADSDVGSSDNKPQPTQKSTGCDEFSSIVSDYLPTTVLQVDVVSHMSSDYSIMEFQQAFGEFKLQDLPENLERSYASSRLTTMSLADLFMEALTHDPGLFQYVMTLYLGCNLKVPLGRFIFEINPRIDSRMDPLPPVSVKYAVQKKGQEPIEMNLLDYLLRYTISENALRLAIEKAKSEGLKVNLWGSNLTQWVLKFKFFASFVCKLCSELAKKREPFGVVTDHTLKSALGVTTFLFEYVRNHYCNDVIFNYSNSNPTLLSACAWFKLYIDQSQTFGCKFNVPLYYGYLEEIIENLQSRIIKKA